MSTRTSRRSSSATRKIGELAVAAPQVVAHRLTRMAMAGPVLSERDRKEFTGMVQEKQQAFFHSWVAMYTEALRIQQTLWMQWFSPTTLMSLWSPQHYSKMPSVWRGSFNRIADAGLTPVHKKAVSNARRLRKTPLR